MNFDSSKTEKIGRDLFQSIIEQCNITDYQFTKYQFANVDCFININGELVEVEIKVRSQYYDTLFLEYKKYQAMKLLLTKPKIKHALYVNFIGNRCYIFNFKNISKKNGCKETNVYANRYTAIDAGKTNKKMIELPTSIATILELKNNKWILIKK